MPTSQTFERDQPGPALRDLRKQRGLTLAEVSERTGLPVSTLSKLETGKMSLTYDKLKRLAAGMQVDVSDLLGADAKTDSQPVSAGRRSISRAGEGHELDTGKYYYRYLAPDLLTKHFVPIYGEVRARSLEEFGELIRHPGEEFIYVLEGVIEVHSEFYAPVRLKAGESIYFDSQMGHAYIAGAPGRCSLLSICSATDTHLLDLHVSPGDTAASEASAQRRAFLNVHESDGAERTEGPAPARKPARRKAAKPR